jgi:voltage-gated potassium channel
MMSKKEEPRGINRFREQLHEIIFEADTPAGKAFDVALLVVILASVLAVMLETVPSLFLKYPKVLLLPGMGLHHCLHH